MSTRLWNGMILRNRSLLQALPLVQAVRRACLPKLQTALEETVAKLLVFEADLPLNFHEFEGTRMWPMSFDGMERRREHTRRWPLDICDMIVADRQRVLVEERPGYDWDFTFSISLIPKEHDLLVLHHIWNSPGYKAVLREVGFEDYHYQDQTDPPPDMPEEEWSRRCDDWYKYYFGAEAEAQASPAFNYTVVDWQDILGCPVDTNNILAATPDETIRRWRVARFLAQLEAARPQRIRRGHYDMWRETERRIPEIRLCEDKETLRSTMLEGLCSELRWRSGR